MLKRISLRTLAVLVLGACWTLPCLAAPQRQHRASYADVENIVHEAEAQFRQQVNDYNDRLRQIDWNHVADSAAARQGSRQTIANNYNSHLQAMIRERNQANARISHLPGVAAATRSRAIQTITRSYQSNSHSLQLRRTEAMNRWNRATAKRR